MAFWDSWSTNQKLAAAAVGGVAGLYLLTKGAGGVGDEGELAIVDVRRPTDDINEIGGAAGPIGRLEINVPITGGIGTPGVPGAPGIPGTPGVPGTPGAGGRGGGGLATRAALLRLRMMQLTGDVLTMRQGGRSDWERARIDKLRERRSHLAEKIPQRPIPAAPAEERAAPSTAEVLGPRETRRSGATRSAAELAVDEQIQLQLRRNGRLV